MGSSRQWTLRWNGQRRLISLAVLVSVCAALFPLPVGWQSKSAKDRSQPFPCQNRPCGCRTADQCWKKCCCFTNSQKLAWAKVHQVRLPEFVVVAAAKECSLAERSTARCCRTTGCETTSCESSPPPPLAVAPAKDVVGEFVYVMTALAQQCQGQPWLWSTLPWAILPEINDSPIMTVSVGEKLALTSATSAVRSERPPVPPPRHVVTIASAV